MSVRARGLVVRRGGNTLLDGVDVDLRPGRITAVLGPNGAGKSTLLGVLCGDTHPDEGSVQLLGASLRSYDALQLARIRTVLPQHDHLAFAFEAQAVVAMGRHPHRETAVQARAHTDAVMGQLDLTALRRRAWTTLSGGERQRVRLARVMAQMRGASRGVVYLDEPTNHLDLRHRRTVATAMQSLSDQGLAVCCVLHDLDLAVQWAHDVILMREGRVVASGPVDGVLTASALQRAYDVPFVAVPVPGRRPLWAAQERAGEIP